MPTRIPPLSPLGERPLLELFRVHVTHTDKATN